MFSINESQKKVLTIWAIIGIVILLAVIIIAIFTPVEKKEQEENITATNSNKIIDRSRYYTVKNAITKYYSYINMHDYESVLQILDESYIRDNDLNKENIKKVLPQSDLSISYQSRIMCLKDIKDGVYSFSVEGEEISANTGSLINEKYYEIVLDGNTSAFSLKPIDKTIYEEVCNGKS